MHIKDTLVNFLYDKDYFISIYDTYIHVFNYKDLVSLTSKLIVLKMDKLYIKDIVKALNDDYKADLKNAWQNALSKAKVLITVIGNTDIDNDRIRASRSIAALPHRSGDTRVRPPVRGAAAENRAAFA